MKNPVFSTLASIARTAATGATVVGMTSTIGPMILAAPAKAEPLIRVWARSILAAAGVQVSARGTEHVPAEGNFVVVVNHQSHFDGLLLATHIDRRIRYIAKKSLFRVPIFGQVLKAVGNVPVDRTGSERDREAIREAVRMVKEETCVGFFAEGTRSADGVLRPFKRGAAILAIEAQVPVVPMAVAGTRHILEKGSPWVHGGRRAALVVGAPIPTAGLTFDDRAELTRRVEQAVSALYAQACADIDEPVPG